MLTFYIITFILTSTRVHNLMELFPLYFVRAQPYHAMRKIVKGFRDWNTSLLNCCLHRLKSRQTTRQDDQDV